MRVLRLMIFLGVAGCGVVLNGQPVPSRAQIIKEIAEKKNQETGVGKASALGDIVKSVRMYASANAPEIAASLGVDLVKTKKLYDSLGSKATAAELRGFIAVVEQERDMARAAAQKIKKSITKSKNKRYALELIAETFELYRVIAEKRIKALGK